MTAAIIKKETVTALDNIAKESMQIMTLAERFEKTFRLADAVNQLRDLLTPAVMEPIMKLQGTKLGYKTDKDSAGGYPSEVVRECLIEATMQGVYPVGNEFNIIAGQCYITKEGFGHKLRDLGRSYMITPGIPKMQEKGAVIDMKIEWDGKHSTVIPFCIRVNAGMGADAIVGKAERKARAWLWRTMTGQEAPEGEAGDDAIDITPASSKSEASKSAAGKLTDALNLGEQQ